MKIINVGSFPNFEQIASSTKEHFKAERPRRPGAGCALMLDDVIYLRLDSIGKAAGINPKDSSDTFAKIFEVRNVDFDNRVKLAEGHGILYGA